MFGITGDLARKMTLRSLYRLERRKLLDCPVIGVAVDDWYVEQLREHARKSIRQAARRSTSRCSRASPRRLSYVSGDFGDPETYDAWPRRSGTAAIPPSTSRSRRRCSRR